MRDHNTKVSSKISRVSYLIGAGLLALCIWVMLPLKGLALDQSVTIGSASAATSGVTVSGTTTANSVMVQVRAENGTDIIDMYSMPVLDGKFSGTVSTTLSAGQTVKVYVADYEGGAFAITSATVPGTPDPSSSNPTTVESNDGGNDGGSGSNLTKKVMSVKEQYTVVKGDTLTKIAWKLGTSLKNLVKWNPEIKNINLIYPGQKINYYVDKEVWVDENGNIVEKKETAGDTTATGEKYYVVKRGDNLSKIAKKLGTTLKVILSKNKFKNPNLIYPGQKVYY